jgi:hypothetical protein
MIHVKTPVGEFKISRRQLVIGNDFFQALFELARQLPYKPQDGPWDYAMATKMIGDLNSSDVEVLAQSYPKSNPEVVY